MTFTSPCQAHHFQHRMYLSWILLRARRLVGGNIAVCLLYSRTFSQALDASSGVLVWKAFVLTIKDLLMRQDTAMAHNKLCKVPSNPRTHSTDRGLVSQEPHIAAGEWLGTFMGAEVPQLQVSIWQKYPTQGSCHFSFMGACSHRGTANKRQWQKEGPHVVVRTKRQPGELRQKTCSFVRWGVQAAELETPPVVPWSCSCWKRAGAKSPASLMLWDVQSAASVGKGDSPAPAELTLPAGALIRSLVGRRGGEGKPQNSPDLPVKILQWDLTSQWGWRVLWCKWRAWLLSSWLEMCPRACAHSSALRRWLQLPLAHLCF